MSTAGHDSELARPSAADLPLSGTALGSFDEFSTLHAVVLGTAAGARVPSSVDLSAWLNLYPELTGTELRAMGDGEFPAWLLDEAEQDLAEISRVLSGAGITVLRPDAPATDESFGAPGWQSSGFYAYCPRDVALVVGGTVIETPSPMRARYFETFSFRRIFQGLQDAGVLWLAAPKPQLADELYAIDEDGRPRLLELEPVFEAANVLRCGQDAFYQVSTSGNERGYRGLAQLLDRLYGIRLHAIRQLYPYTHIDSTLALLRPGLLLANPARVTREALPEVLQGWDILWCPPLPVHQVPPHALSSSWIGMNLLMLAPDCALVDRSQLELISVLEKAGIAVEPVALRHAQTLGGGAHCVTLDLHRAGGLVDYFG